MARPTALACLLLLIVAQAASQAAEPVSSSRKVSDNPAAQYVLVKTVVGKMLGAIDARAEPIDPDGYNLLKYCWTPANVLGDWAEQAGLAGQMVVRALETLSWQRDLVRAGYPAEPLAQAIGRYEATIVSARLTDASRASALQALVAELDSLRHGSPGAAEARAVPRCSIASKPLALNVKLVPDDGRARFMPYVMHQICQAQELDADDPVRCDYWLEGNKDQPTTFAGETVYAVRWPDGVVATGRFDPDALRSDATVTLRRPAVKAKPQIYKREWAAPYFGASTITIWRPSMRGIDSILVSGSISPRTRLRTCRPSSACTISRPRKRSVTLTLSPSSMKRFIAFIFTS
jgi:hypothetical protein